MYTTIKENIAKSLAENLKEDVNHIFSLLEKPKNDFHGDLTLPCFVIAKKQKTSPVALAKSLKTSLELPESISKIVEMGPFLNFFFDYEKISPVIISSLTLTKTTTKKNETILIDYSSPNVAKPFHVGHLRATLIGNCLDRLHQFNGYDVESINHLGDWGTQFGFVFAGCKLWGEPEEFSVKSLVELYKKATALKDLEEQNQSANAANSVTSIARNYFIKLESGNDEAKHFWQRCVDVSLVYLKNTYERLHVSFKHYTGESFYSDKLDPVKNELISLHLLKESQGAYGVELGEELGFARILAPDGRSLYLARDIAAAEYRFQTFNFSKCIYVVGAPQTLHFKQLKEVLKLSGKKYVEGIIHLPFGHVLGMKTRGEGQAIELNEFLDEANSRALKAYSEAVQKRPEGINEKEVSEAVALAAVIFSTLNRSNIKDVHFSWEEALSFQGDSGPYLLYAYARLCGIQEKANTTGITLEKDFYYPAIATESAQALVAKLLDFESVLVETEKTLEPLILCNFALELSKLISKSYIDLKVIGSENKVASTRLKLFLAAKETLGRTLTLLGITPIERM